MRVERLSGCDKNFVVETHLITIFALERLFTCNTTRAKRRNEKSCCKFKSSALTSMQHLMLHHVGMLRKCLLAAGTLVRLQTCLGKAATLQEGLRDSSVIRLTVVHQVVALQIRQLRERLVANRAGEGWRKVMKTGFWGTWPRRLTHHTNGRSPECALVCFHTLLWLGKCFPHNSHLYLLSVRCFAWWATISSLVSKRCWRESRGVR